jgi:hypothetical protein
MVIEVSEEQEEDPPIEVEAVEIELLDNEKVSPK